MGHPVQSQRAVIDILLEEVKGYSSALRKEERDILEKMLKEPLKHPGAVSGTGSVDVWAFLLLSILLEQEKRLTKIEKDYDRALPEDL